MSPRAVGRWGVFWVVLGGGALGLALMLMESEAAKIPEPDPKPVREPQNPNKPKIERTLAYQKIARPAPPREVPPERVEKIAAPRPAPEPKAQRAKVEPPPEVAKATPSPKPKAQPRPKRAAKPTAQKRPSPKAATKVATNTAPKSAPRTAKKPVQVRVQSGGWGKGSGPRVLVELPGSAAGLRAFAVAHGAGFALSRRVAGNRAEVVTLLKWQGQRLVARGGDARPAWLSWTPRLLVDPAQLRNVGHPAGGRGLLTQIFIRGGALREAVASSLTRAGLRGSNRAALIKAAAGRNVTCRGQRNGAFECRMDRGGHAP